VQLPPEGVDIELLHDATRREARGGWFCYSCNVSSVWEFIRLEYHIRYRSCLRKKLLRTVMNLIASIYVRSYLMCVHGEITDDKNFHSARSIYSNMWI